MFTSYFLLRVSDTLNSAIQPETIAFYLVLPKRYNKAYGTVNYYRSTHARYFTTLQ